MSRQRPYTGFQKSLIRSTERRERIEEEFRNRPRLNPRHPFVAESWDPIRARLPTNPQPAETTT